MTLEALMQRLQHTKALRLQITALNNSGMVTVVQYLLKHWENFGILISMGSLLLF